MEGAIDEGGVVDTVVDVRAWVGDAGGGMEVAVVLTGVTGTGVEAVGVAVSCGGGVEGRSTGVGTSSTGFGIASASGAA